MNILLFEADEIAPDGKVRLPSHDSRSVHLRSVLRSGAGDTIRIGVPGRGRADASVLTHDATFSVLEVGAFQPEPEIGSLLPVDVLLGSVRPIQLKRLLRDLTAMVVRRIIVARAELSERSYFDATIWEPSKMRRLLFEGAAQGGHTSIPDVHRLHSIAEGIDFLSVPQSSSQTVDGRSTTEREVLRLRLARGYPAAHRMLAGRSAALVHLAIGPERGFTRAEEVLLDECSFTAIGIPGGILRSETATVAALSVVRSVVCLSP